MILVKLEYVKEIASLNIELNKWNNLSIFIYRFLFTYNVGTSTVDIIYHVTIESGIWATRKEIIHYIKTGFPKYF